MQENKSQHLLQRGWSSHYTALAAMDSELPGIFQMATSEHHLSKVGILTISLTVCLSLLLARPLSQLHRMGMMRNLVFEMRSHSISNKPSVRQNSRAVWSIATAFLFTCHSSALLFLLPRCSFSPSPRAAKGMSGQILTTRGVILIAPR